MPDDTPQTSASPCIGVCTVDKVEKICIGCLRTLNEIGAWRVMSYDEKAAVVSDLEQRRAKTQPRDKKGRPIPA